MTIQRAAAYARFSSDNQRDESIDAQVRAIEAYCKQKGFELVKIYIDRAKSATSDKRPQFQQMIVDSEKGLLMCSSFISWIVSAGTNTTVLNTNAN
ncbi:MULTISPECIES: recombinase family protein [unclassified Paenibacillus]|uniref:recombinase family protein n=1 Tax=unclassified Paenibacillus TaxID=185978 RepID=UPI0038370DA2